MLIKIVDINEEESPFNGLQEKSIYLKKDKEIIGLHAIGEPDSEWNLIKLDGSRVGQKGFKQHEQWGNHYDENHNMLGRGSFRIFDDIEETAKELEIDGWIVYEGPKVK